MMYKLRIVIIVIAGLAIIVQHSLSADQQELNAIEWFKKGFSYTANSKYKEAIYAYTQAIRLNPKYAAAYANRGTEYSALGDYRRWTPVIGQPETGNKL